MMNVCIPISWDYPRRGRRMVFKCIAASSMPGKGRAAVIDTRRRFLELKSYGGKLLCETVAVLPPSHVGCKSPT